MSGNNLFLFGAGFTKSVFESAPLNADLLQNLIRNKPQSLLRHYQKTYQTNDIEILLTLLDLEIAQSEIRNQANDNRNPRKDRLRINEEIASYFQQFRFQEGIIHDKSWLETLASKLFRNSDSIITLNYDCFLEGLLDYFEVWSPNGGYASVRNILADSLPQNPKSIRVYKIHGSENFIESGMLPNKVQTAISFEINAEIYPKSGAYTHFGGGMIEPKPYIIAPSFVKIPHVTIADMMTKALKCAGSAENMIIAGCGLRQEDGFLRLLLVSFLNRPSTNSRKLILVDPSAKEIEEKISSYWIGKLSDVVLLHQMPTGLESSVSNLIKELHDNRA
jgi:hypothetical protein